jgi:hypothetical protein
MSSLLADRADRSERCQASRPWWAIARHIIAGWLIVCLAPAAAMSQDVSPPPPAASSSAASSPATAATPLQRLNGPIQYVGPDTYILLDDQGRPQPVLGMSYEDFVAAWRQSQHLDAAQDQPRFTIERLQINGKTRQRRAELEIEITVRLLSEQPVMVPLGLSGAILRSPPEISSANDLGGWPVARGEHKGEEDLQPKNIHTLPKGEGTGAYLDYDPQRGGFVAGLRGQPDERRTLRLIAFVPLVQSGDDTALELNCPRALVGRLSLDVDSVVSEASAGDGAVLTSTPIDGGTRLAIDGLAGQCRLAWKTPGAERTELASVLSVTGAIIVSIDGRSVQTDAHLTVRSYGGSFDRFRVRLPPGAKLIEGRSAGKTAAVPAYHLTLEDHTGDASPGGAQVVLVQLPAKQSGPVEVDLSTEQPLGLTEAGHAVELAGFEVLGAVRQFGDVGLRVANDWQSRWELGRNVRQVEPDDLAPQLEQQPLTAAFQYDRQPWSLSVRVAARQFRVHLTPDYELQCLPDEARLRVHLVYQVLGARAFEFRVALGDWELTADPIESGGLVDRDRVLVTPDGLLVLPLLAASPRRAEVTFQLRRALDRKQSRIEVPLPTPLADSMATGELVVRAAAGIELAPHADHSSDLVPTSATDTTPSTDEEGQPVFHFRCLSPGATFVAERIVRPREVSIEMAARLDVSADEARVEEQLDCLVRYEPLRELVLDVPDDWPPERQVEAVLMSASAESEAAGSPPAPLSVVSGGDETATTAGGSRTRRVRVPFPQPRLGRFSVVLRYVATRTAGNPRGGQWSVPLAQPVEGHLAGQRATVRAASGWSVGLDPAAIDSAWQPVDRSHVAGSDSPTALAGTWRGGTIDEFFASEPQLALPLVLESVDLATPSATTIKRVWLQAWLSAGVVQMRAAFRLHSEAPVIAVELPSGVLPQEVEVLLDGRLATLQSRDQGRLVVRLSTDSVEEQGDVDAGRAANIDHTLELRYRLQSADGLVVKRRWTPPQLAGLTALSELYWHVVLPSDVHVVRSPAQLTPTGRWQWLGGFWGRLPERTQTELESWVGASAQLTPSAVQNQYLFSGVVPVASIEVVTMPRWLIVLGASGAVMAVVLAWIYVPVARRGWIVIALAVAVAALAVACPTPAMLFGQAAVLGVGAASVAVVLARLLVRPVPWSRPAGGSTMVRFGASRSESVSAPPAGTTATPTAPRPVSDSHR